MINKMSNYSNSLDFKLEEENDKKNKKDKSNNKEDKVSRNIYKVVSIPVKYENGEKVCIFNTVPVDNIEF